MKRKYNPSPTDSPFVRWLLEQANQRELSLAELGRRAGLSTGTLRGLVYVAGRQPTLDTCLRLARTLGLPHEQVLGAAGLSPDLPANTHLLDPNRVEVLQIYDRLPSPARQAMLDTIKAWSKCLTPGQGV